MCSSNKVFIYNDQCVSKESAKDLKDFFRLNHHIFANTPDIVEFSAPFNADDLKCPTFIVPGGSTLGMYKGVVNVFTKIRSSTVGENFNYIGICAGALLATESADIFTSSPYFKYLWKMNGMGLISSYKTVGAFCPVEKVNPSKQIHVPYSVTIHLENNPELTTIIPSTKQLFVNGPGFFAVKNTSPEEVEVVASYGDRKSYDFAYRNQTVSVAGSLPAMINAKYNDGRGARFLSGTHFEASVANSRMLQAFEKTSVDTSCEGLHMDEYALLSDEQEQQKTQATMSSMLKRYLK